MTPSVTLKISAEEGPPTRITYLPGIDGGELRIRTAFRADVTTAVPAAQAAALHELLRNASVPAAAAAEGVAIGARYHLEVGHYPVCASYTWVNVAPPAWRPLALIAAALMELSGLAPAVRGVDDA
ncbi:MAG TPA: hypothetical protein VK939_11525 [Longimicrobiales bacterium]|nr:hypothetical protein [Longimicrobiales bacterium]